MVALDLAVACGVCRGGFGGGGSRGDEAARVGRGCGCRRTRCRSSLARRRRPWARKKSRARSVNAVTVGADLVVVRSLSSASRLAVVDDRSARIPSRRAVSAVCASPRELVAGLLEATEFLDVHVQQLARGARPQVADDWRGARAAGDVSSRRAARPDGPSNARARYSGASAKRRGAPPRLLAQHADFARRSSAGTCSGEWRGRLDAFRQTRQRHTLGRTRAGASAGPTSTRSTSTTFAQAAAWREQSLPARSRGARLPNVHAQLKRGSIGAASGPP